MENAGEAPSIPKIRHPQEGDNYDAEKFNAICGKDKMEGLELSKR